MSKSGRCIDGSEDSTTINLTLRKPPAYEMTIAPLGAVRSLAMRVRTAPSAPPRFSVLLHLAARCLVATAADAAQTSDQQTCINEMNKRGSLVVKAQGKADYTCVRDAGKGNVENLGVPPQAQ